VIVKQFSDLIDEISVASNFLG
jgi:hypothetical protein